MRVGLRSAVAWVCLIGLAMSFGCPTVRLPDQTVNGFELVGLGAHSGASRLFGDSAVGLRAQGALMLLAIVGNVLIPAVWFTRRHLGGTFSLIVCSISLAASVVLTFRVAAHPAAHWLWGMGVWYAAVTGLLCARFWPARE